MNKPNKKQVGSVSCMLCDRFLIGVLIDLTRRYIFKIELFAYTSTSKYKKKLHGLSQRANYTDRATTSKYRLI
jgi:hypothetical protein